MARPIPDPLDVGQLAAQRTRLECDYPLDGFGRLRDSIARPEGQVAVDFQFHAAGSYPALEGTVRARAWLVCQRCLAAFEADLVSPVRVAFVSRDAEAGRVPEAYDAVTAPEGRLSLAELVEDEVMLALPLVPMHANASECALQLAAAAAEVQAPAGATPARGPTQRPFADLRELLKR
jgi:uncharacterized protein